MALSTLSLRLRELLSPISLEGAARYTASDVRSLLDPSARDPLAPTAASDAAEDRLEERCDTVLEIAARPSAWTDRLGRRQAWELGRLADRLPSIVSLYARGTPIEEIGRREGCLTTYTVERALDVACACIAEVLSSRRRADAQLVA